MKISCISDRCIVCGSNHKLTVDHIVPKSTGGTSGRMNYMILCWTCNQAKKNLDPIDWLNGLGDKASDTLREIVLFAVGIHRQMKEGVFQPRYNSKGQHVGYMIDHITCNRCGNLPKYMTTRQDYCRKCVHLHYNHSSSSSTSVQQ